MGVVRRTVGTGLVGAIMLLCLSACQKTSAPASAPTASSMLPPTPLGQTQAVITPLPETIQLNPTKVELGRRLYFDPRLSSDNSVSCNSCHPLSNYGVQNIPVSFGVDGRPGDINAPTVLNSGFNFRQFWNGRAATLQDQINGPVHNPNEMNVHWPVVMAKLARDQRLENLSNQAYGHALDAATVRDAIATFERSLITPDAPFDRYLRGDKTALSAQAHEGWRLFRDLGCVSCHQGMNIGGNMYATFGVMNDYFQGRPLRKADYGRYNVTGQPGDKFVFKVPSLRNVAQTAPYFHDGAVATLPQAVDVMAHTQLGITLTTEQRDALVAFLQSLTGRLPNIQP